MLALVTACGEDEQPDGQRERGDGGVEAAVLEDATRADADAFADVKADRQCQLRYTKPGCDGGVEPECLESWDACAGPWACDCQGQPVLLGCGHSSEPFSSSSACLAEAGSDFGTDAEGGP